MIMNDDGSIVAYAMTGGAVKFWVAADDTAEEWNLSSTSFKACCNDPILWKGTDGKWYAATADHGSGGKNYGRETFYTSPALVGPSAKWAAISVFFENQESILVPGHPQQKEFVSPDYFDAIPGSASVNVSVFMTSTYGNMDNVSGIPRPGIYNFAAFFVGSQPAGAGTPFVPNAKLTQAVDWSCFSPSSVTEGGLDLAYAHGPSQYGCCPKTGAGPAVSAGRPRRILFGWQQDGNSDGSAQKDNDMNAMTLPREVSISPSSGAILQQYIPELQQLRVQNWMEAQSRSQKALPFPNGGGVAGAMPLPAAGAQLEISAMISYGSNATKFGFLVLAGGQEEMNGYSEYTEVGFDVLRKQIYVDRTHCGTELDADIRAGPWPTEPAHAAGYKALAEGPKTVSLHMYVDHAIVTLIVNNQTAFSVWAHPSNSRSTGVAIWAEKPGMGVAAESLSVWQLRDPQ
jgi:sucrose-6-phosphate hydrolase SacC (GH32 family)